MAITGNGSGSADFLATLKDWLGANWDPDLTVGAWWERLGPCRAGPHPACPRRASAKGLSRAGRGAGPEGHRRVRQPQAPRWPGDDVGRRRPSPASGTTDQRERMSGPSSPGAEAWCQLFSEPGAGSDLAGCRPGRSETGTAGCVSGQKVRTPGGQVGRPGHAPGPDRSRRTQASGHHLLRLRYAPTRGGGATPAGDDGTVPLQRGVHHRSPCSSDDAIIGGLNNGWAVANTTLAFERASLGSWRR